MTKSKRQPKNFFRYFLDEYILFRREFVFETDVDFETVVYRLRELPNVDNGSWPHKKRIISKLNHFQDTWEFTLEAERRYSTTAWTKGKVYINATGKTILEARLWISVNSEMWGALGIFLFVICFLTAFFRLLDFHPLVFLGLGILAASLIRLAWLPLYADYSRLYEVIEQIATEENLSLDTEENASD